MKKFLKVTVTMHNGSTFSNPLKLSEARFVSQLAQENAFVKVESVEVSNLQFKSIFG